MRMFAGSAQVFGGELLRTGRSVTGVTDKL